MLSKHCCSCSHQSHFQNYVNAFLFTVFIGYVTCTYTALFCFFGRRRYSVNRRDTRGSVLSTRGRGLGRLFAYFFLLCFGRLICSCKSARGFLSGSELVDVLINSSGVAFMYDVCLFFFCSLCVFVFLSFSGRVLPSSLSGTTFICLKTQPKAGSTGEVVEMQEHGNRSA